MFELTFDINGIEVRAKYSDKSVNEIFIPLLKRLTDLSRKKGRRILVLLAAPPAAGKSTICEFLKYLAYETHGVKSVTAIGMDGFHRYQDYLTSHTMKRNGEDILMVELKGAHETFDLEKLTERIKRVAAGEACGWPVYDRINHNPVEDAQTVDGEIIFLEGNYLLLDLPGWRDLKQYADYTVKIEADEKDLRDRLIARKSASGNSYEKAAAFVDRSDLYNARVCLEQSVDADICLKMDASGEYFLNES